MRPPAHGIMRVVARLPVMWSADGTKYSPQKIGVEAPVQAFARYRHAEISAHRWPLGATREDNSPGRRHWRLRRRARGIQPTHERTYHRHRHGVRAHPAPGPQAREPVVRGSVQDYG